MLTNKTLL